LSGANAIIERLWSCILPVFNVKCGKNRCPALDKEAGSQRGFYSVRKHQVQKTLENCRPDDYTPESLKAKGWKKV